MTVRVNLLFLCAALVGCAHVTDRPSEPTREALRTHIKHIVFVIQENRSFDNVFHGLPNADSATTGRTHAGRRVELHPVSFLAPYDLSNGFADFARSYDHGRMDGYDLRRAGAGPGARGKRVRIPFASFGYLPRSEVEPYFALARNFAVADRMFQSNIDQSFAAHLFLIAGQAAHTANVPTAKPWGCDGGEHNVVTVLDSRRRPVRSVFPCFTFPTLADRLESARLSWRYYAPHTDSIATWRAFDASGAVGYPSGTRAQPDFGQLWSAFDAIAPVRYGIEWSNDVVSPETRVLKDARAGDLPAVTWVVPDWQNSDHSLSRSTTGPDWVASVVNAVGTGPLWNETLIAVVWDDSGGWYDHVPPPQLDQDGLGIRVPLIVISPYAKRGYVSHTQYEFGSLLKFAEDVFGLMPLAASDRRARSIADCLDFEQAPRPFVPVPTRRTIAQFERESPSEIPPDDD